jgi:hypothetical protein
MGQTELEQRVLILEQEVARLRSRLDKAKIAGEDWSDTIYGTFAKHPDFEEAVRLGREWRESFGPKPRKSRKK